MSTYVSPSLKSVLSYKRFSGIPKILMIDSPYYGTREAKETIVSLGWELSVVKLENLVEAEERFLKELLLKTAKFKPDFILTINHFGFDEKGILASIFKEYNIICASWFIDSPLFIIENPDLQNFETLFIFSWDSFYVDALKSMGFTNVYYLPLGFSPKYFYPSNTNTIKKQKCSFVGNSTEYGINKSLRMLKYKSLPPLVLEKARELALIKANEGKNGLYKYLREIIIESMTKEERIKSTRLFALTAWVANQEYRKLMLKGLQGFDLTVFGDDGWKKLLNGNTQLKPVVNYYSELRDVYAGSEININLTSIQMPHGVNQRVLDVPATGAFLITDNQKDLHSLFEVGREVVVFETSQELTDIVKFYLANSSLRDKISAAAYERAIKDHTYERRLLNMYKSIKKVVSKL